MYISVNLLTIVQNGARGAGLSPDFFLSFFFIMQKDPEAPAAAEEFVFSSTVEHTLGAIFPSDDPLDAASFDPIAFVNANFPNERSLSRMDTFLAQTERKIAQLDDEIFGAVVAQAAAG